MLKIQSQQKHQAHANRHEKVPLEHDCNDFQKDANDINSPYNMIIVSEMNCSNLLVSKEIPIHCA